MARRLILVTLTLVLLGTGCQSPQHSAPPAWREPTYVDDIDW